MTLPFETYFDPFSGTMIEDIGDDDVFVAERDVKIPEGRLVQLINAIHFGSKRFWQSVWQRSLLPNEIDCSVNNHI